MDEGGKEEIAVASTYLSVEATAPPFYAKSRVAS